MIPAAEALKRLKEGNQRFLPQYPDKGLIADRTPQPELAAGQSPFAVVLGCSDSRVPVEIIFDQGFGDLFVIRVAGNIVAPSQVASIEFAVEQFDTRLVVVMGHSMCGAVTATLRQVMEPTEDQLPNLSSITGKVRPAAEAALKQGPAEPFEALTKRAVRLNIQSSVRQLRQNSPTLRRRISPDDVWIVGAEYDLKTGAVDFFDD